MNRKYNSMDTSIDINNYVCDPNDRDLNYTMAVLADKLTVSTRTINRWLKTRRLGCIHKKDTHRPLFPKTYIHDVFKGIVFFAHDPTSIEDIPSSILITELKRRKTAGIL